MYGVTGIKQHAALPHLLCVVPAGPQDSGGSRSAACLLTSSGGCSYSVSKVCSPRLQPVLLGSSLFSTLQQRPPWARRVGTADTDVTRLTACVCCPCLTPLQATAISEREICRASAWKPTNHPVPTATFSTPLLCLLLIHCRHRRVFGRRCCCRGLPLLGRRVSCIGCVSRLPCSTLAWVIEGVGVSTRNLVEVADLRRGGRCGVGVGNVALRGGPSRRRWHLRPVRRSRGGARQQPLRGLQRSRRCVRS